MTRSPLTSLLAIGCVLTIPAQAAEQPDFSGAWTTYRTAGGPGGFNAPTGTPLQYTPAAQKAIEDYRLVTQGTDYSPGNACVGSGMPGSMLGSGGYPMEIVQRPEMLVVIYEAHNELRRFYVGDEARNPEDFFNERNGYSIARWDGDRLIVDTSRLKTQVDSRFPHSNQATIHEEYYLDKPLEDGTRVLVSEMTMTDPLWLTEPLKSTKRWQQMADYHVLTYECPEPKWLDEMQKLYDKAGLPMVQE